MSSPTLVLLPFVLLLLDYWPLQRFTSETGAPVRIIREKLPLLALSAAYFIVAVMARESAMGRPETYQMTQRLGNAVVSSVHYGVQMFWPTGLAPFYPQNHLPVWETLGAALILAMVSAAAWKWRERHPYLLTGWFWYLVMLVLPMIGLVQAGSQIRTDRSTYLSQIGLYILVT